VILICITSKEAQATSASQLLARWSRNNHP
jgi:hypothetical protein